MVLLSMEEKLVRVKRTLGTKLSKEKRLLCSLSILAVASLTLAQIKQCVAWDLASC